MDVFRELLKRGREAKARGQSAREALAEISPGLRQLRSSITKDDPKLNQQFDIYLMTWFLHRVYDELNGPLSDAIVPPPPG
jgi:hypothetical protein